MDRFSRGEPANASRVRVESEALSYPPGRWPIARHAVGNALADEGSRSQRSGRRRCVVARRPHISASQLVAFAARHQIERHDGHLQSEGRLTLDVVARGMHECLRIHWGTPHERKGQVILIERLGRGKPLSLFALCRINQVAKDSTWLAIASLVDGVISNCTGRRVFRWATIARAATRSQISRTVNGDSLPHRHPARLIGSSRSLVPLVRFRMIGSELQKLPRILNQIQVP